MADRADVRRWQHDNERRKVAGLAPVAWSIYVKRLERKRGT